MKKSSLLLVAIALLACNVSFAQDKEKSEEEGYIFKITKELPVTSVKDQNRAGTCWCYSGLAFIESELLRMGKGEYDLSEMYIVSNTYNDRAKAAVRMHGDVSFSQGGSFYDVIYGMKTFGLVPESEMRPGAAYGDTLSDHGELSDVTNAIVDAIAKKEHKKLQCDANGNPLWLKSIEAVHEVYLGKCPTEFSYNGVKYTPMSFYNSLGLNPDDYISITSYTHHPFYEKFVLEIQDNWRWGQSYNLPLDEMMQVFDYAIDNGYQHQERFLRASRPRSESSGGFRYGALDRLDRDRAQQGVPDQAHAATLGDPTGASVRIRQLGDHRRPRYVDLR